MCHWFFSPVIGYRYTKKTLVGEVIYKTELWKCKIKPTAAVQPNLDPIRLKLDSKIHEVEDCKVLNVFVVAFTENE